MIEALDYSISDLAQKYADMYSGRPAGDLETHHSEYMEGMVCSNHCSHNKMCRST